MPGLDQNARSFLAEAALALTCGQPGYTGLWQDQAGDRSVSTAPERHPHRWVLRARIDAVVARTYNLERQHYEHLLRSFSHRSFPDAAVLCLEAFDALETGQPSLVI